MSWRSDCSPLTARSGACNQAAALVTGTFAVTAVGAFYALRGVHLDQARLYLRNGAFAGVAAAVLVAQPALLVAYPKSLMPSVVSWRSTSSLFDRRRFHGSGYGTSGEQTEVTTMSSDKVAAFAGTLAEFYDRYLV